MQKEVWKDIPGYEGYYQVSNLGRVLSVDRYVPTHVDKLFHVREWFIKIRVGTTGYLTVDLRKLGAKKTKKVHQLMAMAFLNHEPCGYDLVVDHIDNNPLNNNLKNLQIITHRRNTTKDKKNGTSKYVGVSFDKSRNKWYAGISINGSSVFLGRFKNEIDAHKAYQNKLSELEIK